MIWESSKMNPFPLVTQSLITATISAAGNDSQHLWWKWDWIFYYNYFSPIVIDCDTIEFLSGCKWSQISGAPRQCNPIILTNGALKLDNKPLSLSKLFPNLQKRLITQPERAADGSWTTVSGLCLTLRVMKSKTMGD